jgi:ribosome-binding protein aMBF1 (putative translation factor)
MKVHEKIYRTRVNAGISQVALGLRLKHSQAWVSRLERGIEKAPREVIARVLSEIECAKALRESPKH